MAIAGIPQGLTVQTGNGSNYLLWNISTGATSYQIQRSTDGVNYTNYATSNTFSYLDTVVLLGVQYWYQVASINGSGTSGFSVPQSIIPAPTAEMSLSQLRLTSQQKADRVNSNFVTLPEWNTFINLAMYELYDLLVTVYEDYFLAPLAQFTTNGTTYFYNLPDGQTAFTNSITQQSYIAPPFYKLVGVDLGINNANNAWVTMDKFNTNDRNMFVYPNTASTIFGVFNLRYRVFGNQIEFIPTPSANQPVRLWYVPRLPQLLQETDMTTLGTSGWLQYVIVRAAKYALDKEESDTTKLDMELVALRGRIEESASNRDTGKPDTITNVRLNGAWGSMSGNYGSNGPIGGYALAPLALLAPMLSSANQANGYLADIIHFSQSGLGQALSLVTMIYLANLALSKLSGGVFQSRVRDFFASRFSSLAVHVSNIISRGSKKQMTRVDTLSVVTPVADNEMSFDNTPHMQLIAEPVGLNSSFKMIQPSITSPVNWSNPLPTTVGLINHTPESINKCVHNDSLGLTKRVVNG